MNENSKKAQSIESLGSDSIDLSFYFQSRNNPSLLGINQ